MLFLSTYPHQVDGRRPRFQAGRKELRISIFSNVLHRTERDSGKRDCEVNVKSISIETVYFVKIFIHFRTAPKNFFFLLITFVRDQCEYVLFACIVECVRANSLRRRFSSETLFFFFAFSVLKYLSSFQVAITNMYIACMYVAASTYVQIVVVSVWCSHFCHLSTELHEFDCRMCWSLHFVIHRLFSFFFFFVIGNPHHFSRGTLYHS